MLLKTFYHNRFRCALVLRDEGAQVSGYMKWAEIPSDPTRAKFKLVLSQAIVQHEYLAKHVWADNNTLQFLMLQKEALNTLILLVELEVLANSLGFLKLNPQSVGYK